MSGHPFLAGWNVDKWGLDGRQEERREGCKRFISQCRHFSTSHLIICRPLGDWPDPVSARVWSFLLLKLFVCGMYVLWFSPWLLSSHSVRLRTTTEKAWSRVVEVAGCFEGYGALGANTYTAEFILCSLGCSTAHPQSSHRSSVYLLLVLPRGCVVGIWNVNKLVVVHVRGSNVICGFSQTAPSSTTQGRGWSTKRPTQIRGLFTSQYTMGSKITNLLFADKDVCAGETKTTIMRVVESRKKLYCPIGRRLSIIIFKVFSSFAVLVSFIEFLAPKKMDTFLWMG